MSFEMGNSAGRGMMSVELDEMMRGTGGYAQGPERALMGALLFDGCMGYMVYAVGNGQAASERYKEAFDWVETTGSEYVFAFENVCEALGINPSALRLGLINSVTSKREGGGWKRSRRRDKKVA